MSDDTAESLSRRGTALIRAGNRAEAIALFKQAITADARFMPAYNNLALALIEEGDHASALPIAERGLVIDPTYIPLYAPLLLALKYLGRAEEAIPYLRRAVTIKGGDPQLLSNLGSLLAESGGGGGLKRGKFLKGSWRSIHPIYLPIICCLLSKNSSVKMILSRLWNGF